MMPPSTKRTQQLCGSASKYEYKVEFHEVTHTNHIRKAL